MPIRVTRRKILSGLGPRSALIGLATAALAVSAGGAGPPAPVVLWNGAAAGMSVDQVFALFPTAKPATGQTLEDGALEALNLDATIDGAPADAVFFFKGRALDAVLVERRDLQRDRRRQNLAEAARLVGAASAQYGRPSRCIERRDIATVDCAWRGGGLRVAVAYHDFGGGSPALSILYRGSG
jgi:hypothetical protein